MTAIGDIASALAESTPTAPSPPPWARPATAKPEAVVVKPPTGPGRVELGTDPGATPESLLDVPGFINEVASYCMATAPYPNKVLAFGGALALQAMLASRKVRTEGDIRPHLYLLTLAPSGSGKDWPRKTIKEVLARTGFRDAVGDKFASGPGIEDALLRSPAKLYLTDEFDQLLSTMASKNNDPTARVIESTLLTMYGAANSTHYMRDKAGQDAAGMIVNPHLNIFGTAIPVHFYGAMNERLLTNGLFGRLFVLDASGPRQAGDAKPIDPPDSILTTARWWRQFTPGGDLGMANPVARIVPFGGRAKKMMADLRDDFNGQYNAAPEDDEVTRSVLARGHEQAGKLALLYAVSENHLSPGIGEDAARWAAAFVKHQIRRMLAMANVYGCLSAFERDCQKVLAKLRAQPDGTMQHSVLMTYMRLDSPSFKKVMDTLIERGDVEENKNHTAGRTASTYKAKGKSK